MDDVKRQMAADEKIFKQVLTRNVMLPLALSTGMAALYVVLVFQLLDVNRWVEHTERVMAEANHLLRLTIDTQTRFRGFQLTGDSIHIEAFTRARGEIPEQLNKLGKLVTDNPSQIERLESIGRRIGDWLAFADVTRKVGKTTRERELQAKQIMDDIRDRFSDFIGNEAKLLDERRQASATSTRWALALSIGLSLFAGFLLMLFGRRQLLFLSRRFGESLKRSHDQNEILETQAWQQTAQAGLSDVVRGELSIEEAAEKALGFLAHYLDAQVGRIFLFDGGSHLVATAGYAYDERTGGETRYALGQGAVGQCAAERKPYLLSEVPENYLRVSSSLGATAPRFIWTYPLQVDGALKGVIELAFLKAPDARSAELLDEATVKVAMAIHSAQYRTQLKDLLEETQRQGEELQAQQEELEQNNADLQQKSQELLAQQHSLEQTNTELEAQQTFLEEQKQRMEEANLELKRAQQEAKEKARNLEVASKYKSEFLANMSHELRTPLNSILLLSNLLYENSKSTLDSEDTEYAQTIHSSASDLLNLINDILDLSKVEAGKLELTAENTALRDIAISMERTFKPQMTKKGLAFEVRIDPDAPKSIVTDKGRCDQILRNFLSNALKFTEKGSVGVRFRKPKAEEQGFALAIDVTDTGIGIPEDKQKLVFEAFQQADGTISRKFGGTGLGLTIARELGALLGGQILLDSVEGKGTTFTLLLPAQTPDVADVTPPPRAVAPVVPLPHVGKKVTHGIEDDRETLSAGDQHILIVEDDPTFAKFMFTLCKGRGFKCLLAADGEAGISDAVAYLPTAILLDLRLPGVSGLAVLENLKRNMATRHIPIHVVSVEDRTKEVMRMGAIGFASKPVTKEGLEEILDKALARSQKETKRILVIEDNKIEQDNIKRIVGNGDVITHTASTGASALEQIKETAFDCVILDLKLPDMTGFELLTRVQSSGMYCPPVIVYTARDLTKEEQQQLQESSQTIILKGAKSPERLLDEVTLFVHKVEEKLSPTQKEMLQKVRHREEVFQGKQLLLVDDDMRNVFALRSVLLKKGIEVVVGRNGREALERLEEKPDVSAILMDIMMPEMDGIEAIKSIRAQPRFKNTPIIALTAKVMRGDRERCLEAGASDYLPKPVDINSLLSLLRIWLTR